MSWAAGHCRTCESSDFRFAESIGVPGQIQLVRDRCPVCGVTWGRPDVCHVCGGPASAGDWWEVMGFHRPEPLPEADLLEGVVWALEIEADEGGRMPRSEMDRLVAALYPAPVTPLLYYRNAWRTLLGAHLGGMKLGMDRQMEDARLAKG